MTVIIYIYHLYILNVIESQVGSCEPLGDEVVEPLNKPDSLNEVPLINVPLGEFEPLEPFETLHIVTLDTEGDEDE